MDFGVGYFPTHDGMTPGAVGKLVEERGQSALFFAEHTHIPASRESPWQGGKPLPEGLWNPGALVVNKKNIDQILQRQQNAASRQAFFKPVVTKQLADQSKYLVPLPPGL